MIVNFENKPLPVFEAFHRSTAKERMCFGAFGSGKTYSGIDEVHAWALEQPGIRGLVTRKTVPELRDTTEPIFRERMPAGLWEQCKIGRSGGHMESCTYPNGSIVMFRSMDDWNKHRSLNLGFIFWDEANENDEESWDGMASRVRQSDLTAEARARGYSGRITRRGMWGATNPEGKDWLYYRFHPDSPQAKPGTEAFFSRTIDNPFLPPDYVERLLQYPKPWVQRYVLCQFDDFAGRIYEEWGWDTHTVEHPKFGNHERPLVWMGMDPGTENPTAGLWVWVDREQHRLVGIAEYEEANLAAAVHAQAWRAIEAKEHMNVRWRVADPNAIGIRDRGTMVRLETTYSKLGFRFAMGASSHKVRIPQLANLIHTRRFVVSRKACPKTFEALRDYQWKDLTPTQRQKGEESREEPLKKNTHLVECAQYIAGREAPAPQLERFKHRHHDSFTEEAWADVRKHQRRLSTRRAEFGPHPSAGTV